MSRPVLSTILSLALALGPVLPSYAAMDASQGTYFFRYKPTTNPGVGAPGQAAKDIIGPDDAGPKAAGQTVSPPWLNEIVRELNDRDAYAAAGLSPRNRIMLFGGSEESRRNTALEIAKKVRRVFRRGPRRQSDLQPAPRRAHRRSRPT